MALPVGERPVVLGQSWERTDSVNTPKPQFLTYTLKLLRDILNRNLERYTFARGLAFPGARPSLLGLTVDLDLGGACGCRGVRSNERGQARGTIRYRTQWDLAMLPVVPGPSHPAKRLHLFSRLSAIPG